MTLKDRVKQATAEQPAAEPSTDLATQDPTLAWLERRKSLIARALPAHIDEGHFIEAALTSMGKLRNCDTNTIYTALMACARFGLAPDGVRAAIVPFGKTATFVPMYQGLIDVMHRSGKVRAIRVDFICTNDLWEYTPTDPSPKDFFHKPRVELPKEERGDVLLAYAYAWMEGGSRSQVVLLNRQDAIEIRDLYSKAYAYAESTGKRDSAWHTNFDQQWAKSCVRRLAKLVPTSPELVTLLQADVDADEGRPHIITSLAADPAPEQTDPGSSDQPATTWPAAAQPGSGRPDQDGGDEQ
ncbi:recombinase RecT [Streptomyces sp. NPDC087659]|uniref:recombinase RecT n=1 Tax=Streptomyces sp. NPDC087659 TaxID=3365801 RepID=UPI00380A4612